jgi:hypothetical protein
MAFSVPERFKIPGQAQVNIGVKSSILALTEEDRMRLIAANRRTLERLPSTREEEDQRLAVESSAPPRRNSLGYAIWQGTPNRLHATAAIMTVRSDCGQLLRAKKFAIGAT